MRKRRPTTHWRPTQHCVTQEFEMVFRAGIPSTDTALVVGNLFYSSKKQVLKSKVWRAWVKTYKQMCSAARVTLPLLKQLHACAHEDSTSLLKHMQCSIIGSVLDVNEPRHSALLRGFVRFDHTTIWSWEHMTWSHNQYDPTIMWSEERIIIWSSE